MKILSTYKFAMALAIVMVSASSMNAKQEVYYGKTIEVPRWATKNNITEMQNGSEEVFTTGESCTMEPHQFDPRSRKGGTKFRVGLNSIRGYDAAIKEYSTVFGEYLTKTAGMRFDPPLEFEMVPMSFQGFYDAADEGELDFFFANPGIFSCLGVELEASALATVVSRLNVRGRVHELDIFAGVMIAREDRDDIQTIADFKDKIIAAGALSMILAGQVQFYEMMEAGVSYVNDPKQVVFTYNQFDVVNGVLDGRFDVGFVRTDQIERGVDANGDPLDTSLFNVIDPKLYVMENGDLFPFLHSTEMFPEFAFGMLPHIPDQIAMEVQNALFSLNHHADVAETLEACYNEMGPTYCDGLEFPYAFTQEARCDTTKDIAWTALNATREASIAGFRTARSYFSVRTMQEAGGFIVEKDDGEWTCVRSEDLYNGVSCPTGYIKVEQDIFNNQCDEINLPCGEGYDCFCKPCRLEIDVFATNINGENTKLCTQNRTCAEIQQRKTTMFRIVDNSHRESINVRGVLRFDGYTRELPITNANGTFVYEFQVSNDEIGNAILSIYVNDVPIPSAPIGVTFISRDCSGDYSGRDRIPTEDGTCVCKEGDLEMAGACIRSVVIFSVIAALIGTTAVCVSVFYMRHKRNMNDQMWHIDVEEMHFNDPLDIIGQGSFGEVILAEYRGTKVAIKRVLKAKRGVSNISKQGTDGGGSRVIKDVNSSFDGAPSKYQDYDDYGTTDEDGQSSEGLETNEQASSGSRSLDMEAGRSRGPVDLDLLAKLSSGGARNRWTNFCPGGIREEEHYGIKSSIFGSNAGRGSLSATIVAKLFPCFSEHNHRKQEFVMEMRLLSKLRHPCITTVMGAVISPFHDPMLVMEYMEYGSLHDLLLNETMHTGGDIILQIMRDIAQGLRYLHSSKPPIVHGDLKARNILIDSRFRAKVADFGLSEKKKNGLTGTPFFMAPEYLRGRPYTPACDMYSLGIILYEIYARKDPFVGEPLMKVLREVCDPSINRRPQIPNTMPAKMVDIMKKCWSADPYYRTQAKDLDMQLMDMNIQDAEPMTAEMRLNAKDKKNGTDMLYEVFPRHIADALKAGQKVEPENHENVTIFFSDIVGFTNISQTMSALKVSHMLERLYESFDKLARAYKVFKVETIGDAYMGVTNLDESQDDEHVKNIAEFALAAIEAAGKILIDEDDPMKGFIKIRVGFHSGQVVSNVIGSLNPRYGLFGDAVNTASRMESNSKPNRILCSEVSANLLKEQAPHLLVKKRGKLEVKGKGQMVVYWVEKGFKGVSLQGSHPTSQTPAEDEICTKTPNEERTESSLHVDFADEE